MSYSYTDIQRKWDAELRENKEWSVILLPKGEGYYNTYIPPSLSPYLSDQDIIQHLVNLCFIFDNEGVEIPIAIRLMLQREHFLSVKNEYHFGGLVQTAIETKEEVGFKPNAITRTLRNPYYKFDTYDKTSRTEIRRTHRSKLLLLLNVQKHEDNVIELLEDYDLANGLLTFKYLQAKANISRYHLKRLFKELPDLYDMYRTIREASITTKHYANLKN